MVAGKRSRSGHPLFVGGPQIGYFYPGLTLEMDLHGPGWTARGATSAPFPGYILIGRREDFVWTLTSAGADIVDNYVETLCDGSDTKYLYKGKCRSMTPFNAGIDRRPGGHVQPHRARAGDRLRDRRRHARGDLAQALELPARRRRPAALPAAHAREGPQRARLHQGRRDLAADVQHVLRRQRRDRPDHDRPPAAPRQGVDSGLPTDGRGDHEWRGWLATKAHPQAIKRGGVLINWNNKPARGFPAADDQWSYGSIQRVDLLNRNTNKVKRHTLATLTGAMNAAATQDVRAITFVPILSAVLRGGPAPSPRATRMLELLEAWRAKGGSRLDRDLDGKIDDPGRGGARHRLAALADAALTPCSARRSRTSSTTRCTAATTCPPGGQFGGWHMYMSKDLRTLLGGR